MSTLTARLQAPSDWTKRFESHRDERPAMRRLVEGGVDRDSFLFYLWVETRPEGWGARKLASARSLKEFKREVRRFQRLGKSLTGMVGPIDQAVRFFKLPSESPLAEMVNQIEKGTEELERLCAIYSGRGKLAPGALRSPYAFVSSIIHIVRVQFHHRKREPNPWTDDLATVLNAAVNAHDWKVTPRPPVFRGDFIRRYLERHRSSAKPRVIHFD